MESTKAGKKLGVFKKRINCDLLGKFERRKDILQIGDIDNIKMEVEIPECITPEDL